MTRSGGLRPAATPPFWESSYGIGLSHVDDDCDRIPLGFSFTFYGTAYTEIWVNSNGNATFNGCNSQWWHPDVPDGTNVLLAPLYGDFSPEMDGVDSSVLDPNGDVFVNTLGSAPFRRFVATWWNVPPFTETPPFNTGHSTFQLQLFEGTNEILFGYSGLGTDGVQWAFGLPSTDANMDVGISSGDGRFILTASGTAIPVLDGTNVCYRPVGNDYVEIRGGCGAVVSIDIQPGKHPNQVKLQGRADIPVAVLTTSQADGDPVDFDAADIDPSTVAFGPDLAPPTNAPDPTDVDGDGDLDLVFRFSPSATGIGDGDVRACLTGRTIQSESFNGCNAIVVSSLPAPPNRPAPPTALPDELESLTFFVNHNDCSFGWPSSFRFFLNGVELGLLPALDICICHDREPSITFDDLTTREAWNPTGDNTIAVVAETAPPSSGSFLRLAYIRMDVRMRDRQGTFPLFDANGGDASQRNTCEPVPGFVGVIAEQTFTFLLERAAL